MLAGAIGGKLPDVLYDGVVDPSWGKGKNPGQVCLQRNGDSSFLNFDVAGNMTHAVKDVKQYDCVLPSLQAVAIPQLPAGASGTN
jgi:hypothetical protein